VKLKAHKVIEKEELDQCSFTPQINFNSMYLDLDAYQPIQKRLQELMVGMIFAQL
jgi:hypothetical protein